MSLTACSIARYTGTVCRLRSSRSHGLVDQMRDQTGTNGLSTPHLIGLPAFLWLCFKARSPSGIRTNTRQRPKNPCYGLQKPRRDFLGGLQHVSSLRFLSDMQTSGRWQMECTVSGPWGRAGDVDGPKLGTRSKCSKVTQHLPL